MTLRLVQAPESPTSAVVIVYHSGASDGALRAAAPGACIGVETGPGFSHFYDQLGPGHATPLPQAIEQLRSLAGLASFAPSRTILCGWSEGCQAIRSQLQAGERPDACVAADGTHSASSFPAEHIAAWKAYASGAKAGDGAFFASCSAIVPGTYASTRATIERITGFSLNVAGPVSAPVPYSEGQCVVYVCTGDTAADHIDQGQIMLPRMLGEAFASNYSASSGGPRWLRSVAALALGLAVGMAGRRVWKRRGGLRATGRAR